MKTEYLKINSVYKRDMTKPNKPFIVGEYAEEEFEYLKDCKWEWTEKVDGTNIRVELNGEDITFGGKTDNAQIPSHLYGRLQELFFPISRRKVLHDTFEGEWKDIVLYGEGFGYKIQGKVGADYLVDNVDFYLFDVRMGEWWLKREDVYDIADTLGLRKAIVVGYGTIDEAIEKVTIGFASGIGTAMAEGIVLRPAIELQGRDGHRIITKVKHRDFVE